MVLGFAGIFGGNDRAVPVSSIKPFSVKQLQAKAESTFAPAMKAALHTVPMVSQKRAASAKILSSGATYSPASSMTLVHGLAPPSFPTPSSNAPPATATSPTTRAADPPSVVDTLKAALVLAGVDISGMQFNQHQDIVTYPGGSYVNDLISFHASSGQTHEYMTNLVSIAPQVTVTEIQQLMAGNRG